MRIISLKRDMSEIVFILDASALSRRFYDDIGKRNLDTIFDSPNAAFFTPEIGIIETVSALLAAANAGDISLNEYRAAKSALFNLVNNGDLNVVPVDDYVSECVSILETYKTIPGKGFNGTDSLYVYLSKTIADELASSSYDKEVVFVTSDRHLFNACKEEASFHTINFWTCDLGCGHEEFIPKKGAKDRLPKHRQCPSCDSQVVVSDAVDSPNTCLTCGGHCPECRHNRCPSTYVLDLTPYL